MRIRVAWVSGFLALLLVGSTASAVAPPVAPKARKAAKAATAADVQQLAQKIDRHIANRWDKVGVTPAPAADDSEFVRRVYLDLAGRIPSVAETRTFLRDRRSDKRARLVDELLAGSRYVVHFTNVYRALLIPEAGNNFQVRLQQGSFESWLKRRVSKNTSYDQMVRELLTTRLDSGTGPLGIIGTGAPSSLPYYLAKEYKPENLAASTARVFLGVSVECAQCHNHPFADWKREQFWGFTAFFSGVNSNRQMDFLLAAPDDTKKHEIAIPGTKKVVQATFLDGSQPKFAADTKTRTALADWVTSPANPYFARAAVNRAWAFFLGAGLVEPVDEMVGGNSTCSHPELLDLLAKEFIEHDFDVRFLVRALLSSRAYQLTSAVTHPSQEERTMFARMPLRGLTGEQLFDSVSMATGYRDSGGGDDLLSGLLGGNRSARSDFLTKFALAERPTESQTSILHALTLMNGKVMASATSLEKSETLASVVDAPVSSAERVDALYLATLTRKPQAKEIDRTVAFIQEAVSRAKDEPAARKAAYRNALADVFWALLNSPEFILNH